MCGAVRAAIRKARAAGQPEPEVPPPEASQGHVYIVHRLHSADPEDGWLQREWGEVMVSEDRLTDAAVHFEARTIPMLCPPCPTIQHCCCSVTLGHSTCGCCFLHCIILKGMHE
jgi:hypothetical protein